MKPVISTRKSRSTKGSISKRLEQVDLTSSASSDSESEKAYLEKELSQSKAANIQAAIYGKDLLTQNKLLTEKLTHYEQMLHRNEERFGTDYRTVYESKSPNQPKQLDQTTLENQIYHSLLQQSRKLSQQVQSEYNLRMELETKLLELERNRDSVSNKLNKVRLTNEKLEEKLQELEHTNVGLEHQIRILNSTIKEQTKTPRKVSHTSTSTEIFTLDSFQFKTPERKQSQFNQAGSDDLHFPVSISPIPLNLDLKSSIKSPAVRFDDAIPPTDQCSECHLLQLEKDQLMNEKIELESMLISAREECERIQEESMLSLGDYTSLSLMGSLANSPVKSVISKNLYSEKEADSRNPVLSSLVTSVFDPYSPFVNTPESDNQATPQAVNLEQKTPLNYVLFSEELQDNDTPQPCKTAISEDHELQLDIAGKSFENNGEIDLQPVEKDHTGLKKDSTVQIKNPIRLIDTKEHSNSTIWEDRNEFEINGLHPIEKDNQTTDIISETNPSNLDMNHAMISLTPNFATNSNLLAKTTPTDSNLKKLTMTCSSINSESQSFEDKDSMKVNWPIGKRSCSDNRITKIHRDQRRVSSANTTPCHQNPKTPLNSKEFRPSLINTNLSVERMINSPLDSRTAEIAKKDIIENQPVSETHKNTLYVQVVDWGMNSSYLSMSAKESIAQSEKIDNQESLVPEIDKREKQQHNNHTEIENYNMFGGSSHRSIDSAPIKDSVMQLQELSSSTSGKELSIESLTFTMIGSWFQKFNRNNKKPQLRFFWINPYTKSLNWSQQPPSQSSNVKFKSAIMNGMKWRDLPHNHRYYPPSQLNALIIITPTRNIKMIPTSWEAHDQWVTGIRFLLRQTHSDIPLSEQFRMSYGANKSVSGESNGVSGKALHSRFKTTSEYPVDPNNQSRYLNAVSSDDVLNKSFIHSINAESSHSSFYSSHRRLATQPIALEMGGKKSMNRNLARNVTDGTLEGFHVESSPAQNSPHVRRGSEMFQGLLNTPKKLASIFKTPQMKD
ncbi:meiotic cell cortex C-terminal pleckstrin homology-domain-containing protein [Globomyces pollinis-pini]|nr:meiotic cell cortex C-terminal pleckstrin homology-domain-containing protein [Globomyces pollinis-pini]